MEELNKDKIIAFDSYFTEPHIQMLKVLFPYVPSSYQKYLAMYIKFSELQVVIRKFESPYEFYRCKPIPINLEVLSKELLPLCNEKEKAMVENIMNLIHTMDSYKDMMEMVNMQSILALISMLYRVTDLNLDVNL